MRNCYEMGHESCASLVNAAKNLISLEERSLGMDDVQ